MTRTLLLACSIVFVVVGAGCLGSVPGLGDDGKAPIEQVPQGSDVLVHVDVTMVEDEDLDRLSEALKDADPTFDDPENELEAFEEETGLDPEAASEFLVFAEIPDRTAQIDSDDEEFVGLIVHSAWDEAEVIESIEVEEGTEYVRVEHSGEDVLYEPREERDFGTSLYVGVLGDGQFVFGSEEAVTASLDVVYGDAEPVDGEVRALYDELRDGHVKVVVAPNDDLVGAAAPVVPAQEAGVTELVTAAGGVFYTDDGTVGFEGRLHTVDEDGAMDVADMIDGGLATLRQLTMDEAVDDQLRSVEVDHDETTVTVDYQGDVDDLVALIETSSADVGESAAVGDSNAMPTAAIDLQETGETSQVTIAAVGDLDAISFTCATTADSPVAPGLPVGQWHDDPQVGATYELDCGYDEAVVIGEYAGNEAVLIG